MNARIDHLVIAADSLEQGTAWCEALFGVQPSGGGKHALMGTHNHVMDISTERFPQCYLEIIAVDPGAPEPGRPRWFGLDQPALREAVRERPRLVHAVARTAALETLRQGLATCGLDPGVPVAVQRDSPYGTLKWLITVREDGRTECGGALPTLIEWTGPHPCDHLPQTALALQELVLRGVPEEALAVLKMPGVKAGTAKAASSTPLSATLDSPRGTVVIDSWRAGK
ncbi:VOC family protein [Pseudarthrobacter sp. L1SW]|uniref:VOC family protein n=1 Tax=Pseudarthrobacter sp. L1SW TaxID=2851598 RepID=UPI001E649CA5|nr:VOC family protein [Pseudarthrobacter sp. L1SW]UEL27309.1 VOC family protein [Pseudarthrobacter sp. L1SW]